MSDHQADASVVSRREFVAATAAVAGAAAFPIGSALAQTPAKYRRLNVMDPKAGRVLDSYKKAIRAMLALPPSDPRNWYRNALVHTLDCPHGNWWFLVWHRGYIGWFERICRELSGDAEFALPYWDWTQEPRVPAAMFEDVLTPTNPAYIASFEYFKAQFTDTVAAFWNGLTDDQVNQLLIRGLRFPADLWFDIGYPPGPMFFPLANARGLTAADPNLDAVTAKAVSLPTLLNALGPRDFIGFGSPKTFFHSGLTGFAVLEGQPHNLVHNCVGGVFNGNGGFMQSNMSPVDPIFFLHHANIDRIWDVWTRKQQGLKLPTLPQGSDLTTWSQEPFLFYVQPNGQPVTKNSAGDYAEIGDFNYDYQPGSGEEVVPVAVAAAPAPAPAARSFAARVTESVVGAGGPGGTATLPPEAAQAASGGQAVAKVTLAIPPLAHGREFKVQLGGGDIATLAMFGHHIVQGPVTFAVPLSTPAAQLERPGGGAPEIRVVAGARPAPRATEAVSHRHGGTSNAAQILSVVVETQ